MSRSLSVTVAALLSLLVAVPHAGAATKAPNPQPTLKSLIKQTNDLPATVKKKPRAKLARLAVHASKVAKKKPCGAVSDLNRFRRVLRGIRVRKGKKFQGVGRRLARLGPLSIKASQKLLADTRTKRCGGGVRQSTLSDPRTTLIKSDANGMKVRVELPVLRLTDEVAGGKTWTRVEVPDTDVPSEPGKPGIPVVSNTFGVPEGATVKVDPGRSVSYTVDGVDLFPAQPDPVDGATKPPNFLGGVYADRPFTLDNAAYREKGFQPEQPADGAVLGHVRDLAVGNLQVPAVQYDASSKTLKVLKSVDVTIDFQGGSHQFSDSLYNQWEILQNRFALSLMNGRVITNRRIPDIFLRCGEEMMIITNPSTRAAADQLATAKRAQGMRTNVFEVGAGTGQIGTTFTDIQTFIRSHLTSGFCIRPSYVTILGDDDLVPVSPGINGIPSDLPYALRDDADELPDVAVGRILGNDQAAVGIAVTKITGYETNPPTNSTFLHRATVAAQFQDDDDNGQENRTFAQFAETVNRGLTGFGSSVDRVYGESPGNNPQKFNDGTALPAALLKPTFAWNGAGADVTAAWNQGRYLMIHRDHGYSDGWGTPSYGTNNVQALTNGALLPVLMSINCSSAAFDYDETSFVGESLVNPNGGAVAAFGDTRDSPTWHNTQLGLGFVDALQPRVLPSEGPATKQRLGQALINGKLRLAGLSPPGTDGNTRNELYLWHFFGDPSMQMWGGDLLTITLDPGRFQGVFQAYTGPPIPDPPPYEIVFTGGAELQGQAVSLIRNGDVVGKGTIGTDGKATVLAAFGDGSVKPGDLRVAVEPDGGPAVSKQIDGVPQPGPADTSLTSTCPSTIVPFNGQANITGQLTPAFAGAQIDVTVTRPGTRGSFVRSATTDANGNWSITVDTSADDPGGGGSGGTWKAKARYAGDSAHKASEAPECSFVEASG